MPVSPLQKFGLTLFLLFGLPPIACAAFAGALTGSDPSGVSGFPDHFATAAFAAFLILLFVAFVAGPTRIDMTMMRPLGAQPYSIPRAQLQQYTQGRLDFSHLSFPLQVLAGVAAVTILGIGFAVSAL